MNITDRTRISLLALVVASTVVAGGAFATGVGAQESNTTGIDPGDTRANATVIESGETVEVNSSSPENETEFDWFEFDATEGESYTLTAKLDENTSRYDNLAISVFDEDGEEVAELTAGDFPMRTEISSGDYLAQAADIAEANGTFYVRLTENDYNLTLETETLDQYDPNEDPGNATRVDQNATVEATGALYDGDYYAVNLTAGDEFNATLSDEYKQNDWTRNFYVAAPDGDRILPDLDGISFEAHENGTYVISTNFEIVGNDDLVATSEYTLDLQHSPDDVIDNPENETEPPEDGTDDAEDGDDSDDCDL